MTIQARRNVWGSLIEFKILWFRWFLYLKFHLELRLDWIPKLERRHCDVNIFVVFRSFQNFTHNHGAPVNWLNTDVGAFMFIIQVITIFHHIFSGNLKLLFHRTFINIYWSEWNDGLNALLAANGASWIYTACKQTLFNIYCSW